MIPLSDPHVHRSTTPYVTYALLALNVLVFVYQFFLDDLGTFTFTYRFGVVPAELTGPGELTRVPVFVGSGVRMVDVASVVPTWATMFTSMFLHGGFMHLGGNMMFLWVFGDNVEDRFGHLRYLLFYLAAGLLAVLAQVLVSADSLTPMVGASGCIAGVLGAYLVMFPRSRVHTLIFMGIITTLEVPAVFLLGMWALLQLFNGVGSLGPEVVGGGVAYFAHIGGFVAGLGVGLLYRAVARLRSSRGPQTFRR